MICPECMKTEVSVVATRCPYCTTHFSLLRLWGFNLLVLVAAIMWAALAVSVLVWIF